MVLFDTQIFEERSKANDYRGSCNNGNLLRVYLCTGFDTWGSVPDSASASQQPDGFAAERQQ